MCVICFWWVVDNPDNLDEGICDIEMGLLVHLPLQDLLLRAS
jgi:hypothetical protein